MFFEVHNYNCKKFFFTVDITFSTDVSDNNACITEHVTHLIEEGTVIYFILNLHCCCVI